ncbi:MAG: iron-sulfur cluster assembly accessory protein [Bacteroidia bacterium]|nr:iron-sulfur cluster assembly accessory protein [Bacteroidia bacterium]
MTAKNLPLAPFTFTAAALAQIESIRTNLSVPEEYALRIGIQGGGCAGVSYLLGFDVPREEDKVYFGDGMEILMDQRHGMYVMGMEVDYYEDENQAGFVFNNPTERKAAQMEQKTGIE